MMAMGDFFSAMLHQRAIEMAGPKTDNLSFGPRCKILLTLEGYTL